MDHLAANGKVIALDLPDLAAGRILQVENRPTANMSNYAKSNMIAGLWRVGTEGGREEPASEALKPGYWSYWSFGKEGIFYVDREDIDEGGARYPLHYFHLATKKDAVLTYLAKRTFNSGLSVSPDGKKFLHTQVDQSEPDIMMVAGFR